MTSKPLEKSAWDDTVVIDALSDGDADGLPDDTPMALMRGCAEDEIPAGADQEHPLISEGSAAKYSQTRWIRRP